MTNEWWNVPHWKYTPWGYFTFNRPADRTQYYAQALAGGIIPGVAGIHNARDSISYMDDYVRNRGLDYDDILYPSRTVGYSGVSSLGSGMRALSKNITSLYSSDIRKKRRNTDALRKAFYDGRMWEQSYRWHYKP